MKKTVSLLALLMVVLPALVLAYPSIGGGRGLLRVQNALVEDEAGLTISLHALGRNAAFPGAANKKGWVADIIAPELSYAPIVTKYAALELFGSWGGVFQNTKSATQSGFTMSTHDLKAGGKASIPILPVLKLGFTGSYTFMSGREDRTDTYWLDKYALPQAGRDGVPESSPFSWAALATFQLQDVLPTAPNLMVNYGKLNDETHYGLGVELAGKGFALFGEVLSRQRTNSTGLFDTDNGSIYLTPGVVFGNVSAVSLKAAYSFAFGRNGVDNESGIETPVDAVNQLILGLVIATPFGARAKPEYGTITGRVVDEKTGAALNGNVSFPKNNQLVPFATGATGVFEVKKVLTGVTVIEVGARGYQSQTVPLDVTKGGVTTREFRLRSLVAYGVIAGGVTEATSGNPLAATIAFPGTELKSVTANASTGAFRVDKVPVGVYTVTASADGFFTGTQTVQVEDGAVAAPKFALKSLTDLSTFTGRVSDKAKDAPLAATISFPGSDVAAVKSDAGTGVFSTQIPVGSYAVQVEAEGFVSQTAAIVVEKGKPQVKNFTLVKIGMAITLRGIYFDYDKATIKPESRPALEDAAKILNDNPTIRAEIQGHTDSDGSDSYNLGLSDRRAAAVVSYLVMNLGIDAGRLTSRGYGESNPVASNSTAEGKALNRRVEFVVLEAKQK